MLNFDDQIGMDVSMDFYVWVKFENGAMFQMGTKIVYPLLVWNPGNVNPSFKWNFMAWPVKYPYIALKWDYVL